MRRCVWLTRPSEEMSLSVSCSADISIEKIADGTPLAIAAFSAMLTASVVLPMDGRPAITIRSPGWKPVVLRSSSVNPVGTPRISPGDWCSRSSRSMVCGSTSLMATNPDLPRLPRSAISNTRRSASSTSSDAERPWLSVAAAAISPPAATSCRRIERSRMISA